MIDKLIASLPKRLDGMLIVSEVNRLFFTGFQSSDGILLITRNGSVFLTDSRYIEEARKQVTCCEVAELTNAKVELVDYCKKFKCRVLGVEASKLTVNELWFFRKILKWILLTASNTDRYIDDLRMIKSRAETENIIKVQRIAEQAFDYILGFIKEGVTEKEIALQLDFYMLSHGAQALSFETIAISGANTSKPHGVPTDKAVQHGDFVTMDYGAVVNGYHSDMTRTVAVGAVSSEQEKIYNIVLEAQEKALSGLKPDMLCSEGDKLARDVIAKAGYGEYFRHSTGHGVGVEIHEKPNLSPKSEQKLQIGNIVTVEPGIYIPEKFGVRIEDMALITENGCENLTKSPKKLIII